MLGKGSSGKTVIEMLRQDSNPLEGDIVDGGSNFGSVSGNFSGGGGNDLISPMPVSKEFSTGSR